MDDDSDLDHFAGDLDASDDNDDSDGETLQQQQQQQQSTRGNVPGFGSRGVLDDDDGGDDAAVIHAAKKKSKSGGFQSMGLSYAVLNGVLRKGFKVPTPIQRRCIPLVLENRDVVGMARTGSGKTAAFVVPMLERLKTHSAKVGVRGIILAPSRELALQTFKVIKELGRFTDLRFAAIVGGESMEDQFAVLTNNPDIVVATPGRLMHLMLEMDLSLASVEYIVFDEADRLFEMGFEEQLREILHKLPPSRQTLLFSATLPKMLVEFARAGLTDPVLIRLDADSKVSTDLELAFFALPAHSKNAMLLYLLREIIDVDKELTIVFVATKHHVEYLQLLLKHQGYDVAVVYGSLDPEARKLNISRFRAGRARIMIVTDVASRGIDIPLLDNVINYDFPARPKLFVHRVGRAGRNGRFGRAYSFVSPDEMAFVVDLQLFLGRPLIIGSSKLTHADEAKTAIVVGSVPTGLLSLWDETIQELHKSSVDLFNLQHVVQNAYKMYFKTRPEASVESYARAKEINSGGMLGLHPLLADRIDDNENDRLKFLQSIRTFRPPETIFEVGKSAREGAELMAKTRKLHARRLKPASTPLLPPKSVETAEKAPLTAASSTLVHASFKQIVSSDKRGRRKREDDYDGKLQQDEFADGNDDGDDEHDDDDDDQDDDSGVRSGAKPAKQAKSFRDEKHYISHLPQDRHADVGYAVNRGGSFLEQARDAVVDFMGEDAETMRKQKNALTWDKKKRRFVRATVGADNKKRIRTESGALIDASYKTNRYAEWREKNRVALTQTGTVEPPQLIRRKDGRWVPKRTPQDLDAVRAEALDDDAGGDDAGGGVGDKRGNGRGKGKGKAGWSGDAKATATKGGKGDKRPVRSELKSPDEIRKKRRIQQRRQEHVKRRHAEKARKGHKPGGKSGGGGNRRGSAAGKKRR